MEADGDTSYPVETNLLGAYNCLELARRDGAQFVFLSTSRVYPYEALGRVAVDEGETRLEIEPGPELPGVSPAGITEDFPLAGPRTLYGATKLAAELLITEYGARFGFPTVVDRCGVIAGPWQMGKVDQGVFALWALHHHYGVPLSYIGYGGEGRQVRDLLHVEDLCELIELQLADPSDWNGATLNVGGGAGCSLSLLETTELCRELSGNEVAIDSVPETRYGRRPRLPLRLRPPPRAHRLAPAPRRADGDDRRLRLDRAERRRRRPGPGDRRLMPVAVVTGSGGLVGSEAVRRLHARRYDVIGIENDMRARFFGPDASTSHVTEALRREFPRLPLARRRHPRRGRRRLALRRAGHSGRAHRPRGRAAVPRLGREGAHRPTSP